MRTKILGVGFDDVTLEAAVDRSLSLLEEPGGHYVVTPNPEIVYLCRKDGGLLNVVNGADLVLPDGIGVIYAARLLKKPLAGKVAGIDYGDALADAMAGRSKSLFLLGAKPGVAERAAEELKRRHPGLIIAGTADGYFKDDGPVTEKINASGADVVFVCLGAPKQERWMNANRDRVSARLMVGLGGSLDVFAGNVRRAPDVWVRLGLEWLYRLLKEPKRAGRMMKLPLFMLAVLRDGGREQ